MSGDRLPQNFGRYVLRERVGRGGMAEVFRASQSGFGGFDKDVAIKRMFREFSHDTAFVQMLTDEAKILSQLSHPNIVQILDLGQQGQDWFIAFEYIEGVDLFSVLQRHHEDGIDLPVDLACFVVAELCSALDYAHARRGADGEPLHIIHRDVSPQNVLLSLQGEVKLTDFGIAKAAYRYTQTQAGLIKGKVYYMSPEQVLGQDLDHRADLFAAGILLFEALTTRPLYDEPDQPKLFDRVSRAAWQWPADKLARVPEVLQKVVEKALEPRADRRYASGRELRQAIAAAARELNLSLDRESLGTYLRRLYGVEEDRPPTYGAHQAMVRPERQDVRWNSRVDVRVADIPLPPPPDELGDEPTSRDPMLPPRLPVTRQARPVPAGASSGAIPALPPPGPPARPPGPVGAALPAAAAPQAPKAPPAPVAAAPAKSAPVRALASKSSVAPPSQREESEPPPLPPQLRSAEPLRTADAPPAEAPKPAAAVARPVGPPVRPSPRPPGRPVPGDLPPPAPRPLAGPPRQPPASSPGSVAAAVVHGSQPAASSAPRPEPVRGLTPAPVRPEALRAESARAEPARAESAISEPARPETPRPLAPRSVSPRPSSVAPARLTPPPTQRPPVRVSEPKPNALSEEATFEMDQQQLARRLAAARAVVAESETRSVAAMNDADMEDTTRPRPGSVRAPAEPELTDPQLDRDDMPASLRLVLMTAAVWVAAVTVAVYATLVSIRQ